MVYNKNVISCLSEMKIKLVSNLYLHLLNLESNKEGRKKGCCVFKLDVKTHAVYSQEAQDSQSLYTSSLMPNLPI